VLRRFSRIWRFAATCTLIAESALGQVRMDPTSMHDSVVAAALGHLTPTESGRLAPIHVARTCPRDVSIAAEAWARLDGAVREIWVAAYSDTYLSAAAGDSDALKKLAAIIVHEQIHLDCGDEAAAYDGEIFILRRVHAPAAMVRGVQRARDAVLVHGNVSLCRPSLTKGQSHN